MSPAGRDGHYKHRYMIYSMTGATKEAEREALVANL